MNYDLRITNYKIKNMKNIKIFNTNKLKHSSSLLGRLGGVVLCLFLFSCDYLDVVPDNVATIDHAFKNRQEAQRYLYGCYSYMPRVGNPVANPAFFGGDEAWTIASIISVGSTISQLRTIAMGYQNTANPYANYWASKSSGGDLLGGSALWTALSDCNIFLENIHLPYDLEDAEREKWIGEVTFLKAYYCFWLFRMYGPIPVIKENIPIDAVEGAYHYREPVDEVVDYIVSLLDEAVKTLPTAIDNAVEEMGKPTKSIALAVKAQVLTYAASPLFNCNGDYAEYVDNRGLQLFPQDKSVEKEKWRKAADALKAAIDEATSAEAGHILFDYHTSFNATNLSEETILAMQVRGAATERWNQEIIWGNSTTDDNNTSLQRICTPYFNISEANSSGGLKSYAPALQVVEQFYTKNGIPIEEDKDWTGVDLMGLRTAGAEHRQYIAQGYQTINLHFDREARFYGAILFDGGTWYGNQRITSDNTTNAHYMWEIPMKASDLSGTVGANRYSMTGYLCKKLVSCMSTVSTSFSGFRYAFPIIRLADLYLMYAEALNEAGEATPSPNVYTYIDLVRARTGLAGVVESWREHAIEPNKPLTQAGMRDIIRRERLNELAFEGSRYWDLRRWKLAEIYMNRPVRGLNIYGENAADFYQVTEVYPLKFEKKDYFSPIKTSTLIKNPNLLQSPGWK
jgi:hypothetical protein